MSKTPRPLAALAMIAIVALISACGSNAPAATGTRQHRRQCCAGGEVRPVHARQRRQPVPGPGRVRRAHHRWGSKRLVAGHELRGVPAGHQRVQGPGATGVHGQHAERPAAGGGPQVRPVHARQRRAGLPGPHRRWAPHRHDSNPIHGREGPSERSGVQRRDAEVPRLRGGGGGDGARDAEDVGAGRSGRPGCRHRHRRRGRHVQCEASDPGRTGAAGEHREGGNGEALGHGLRGWDPDLLGRNRTARRTP